MKSRLLAINDWLTRGHKAAYDSTKLATSCQVSPSQLRRFFLAYFYRPPQEWLDELRLCNAMKVLAQGQQIKLVAFVFHFGSVPHFCHRFKEYHGCTPSEFQQVHPRFKAALLMRPWVLARRSLISVLLRSRNLTQPHT